MRPRTLRILLVLAVALHSILLGAAMLLFPTRTLDTFGWEYDGPAFFPSQAGIFLLLLGVAYAGAVHHREFAFFLVGSKTCAVVFLVVQYLSNQRQGVVLTAAILDGLMGAAVAAALFLEARSRRSSHRR